MPYGEKFEHGGFLLQVGNEISIGSHCYRIVKINWEHVYGVITTQHGRMVSFDINDPNPYLLDLRLDGWRKIR